MFNPLALLLVCLMAAQAVYGQSEPYAVFDTHPVITEGPYLVAQSASAVSVVWLTDAPSHAKVRLHDGALTRDIEPEVDGLVPVGLRHVVTLTGLAPGHTYTYEAIATRVVKLKPYWPDKGLSTASKPASFTTFDPQQPRVSLAVVTDTHEDSARITRLLGLVDWDHTDALLHLGDAFDWLDSEEQLMRKWLRPTLAKLGPGKSLLYARGNHELRGPFARQLAGYVPTPEGRYYYARESGPLHLLVLDTAEDKPDDTNVYAGLNRSAPYRAAEFDWLAAHLRASSHFAQAPFRVVAMHQPDWGWLADGGQSWQALANGAGVDLVIAGHDHVFSYQAPNAQHRYHLLELGQDQLAQIEADAHQLTVTVRTDRGVPVHTLTIAAKH